MDPSIETTPAADNQVWYDNSPNFVSPGASTSFISDAVSADPAPADPDTDSKHPWEMWDDGLLILDGLATAVFGLINNGKIPISNPDLKKDLIAALYGLNAALHDITLKFRAYIDNSTPIVVDPPVVDEWPTPESTAPTDLTYFQGAFNVLAGAMGMLSASLKKKAEGHPDAEAIIDLLDALIGAEDDVIAKIKAILTPAQPA